MSALCNLYCIGEGLPILDVSGNIGFVSVVDQMNRGKLIGKQIPEWLESCFGSRRLPGKPKRPYLVVGSGACGATIAIQLAQCQNSREVHLIEKQSVPFTRQLHCGTRWLDPFVYEWPSPNWKSDSFPLDQAAGVIPWNAGRSESVALQWIARLREKQATIERLKILWETVIEKDHYEVQTESTILVPMVSRESKWKKYDCVIFAQGPPPELTRCDQYTGPGFWENDLLEQPRSGQDEPDVALVSGSGDGGIQDFIRLLTRLPSVRLVMDELQLNDYRPARATVDLNAQMERASNLLPNPEFLADYKSRLHKSCKDDIATLLNERPDLVQRIQDLCCDRPAELDLVCSSDYFDCMYVLNRFLALLLFEGIRRSCEARGVAPNVRIHNSTRTAVIKPLGTDDPAKSGNEDTTSWHVKLENDFKTTANVIVIRHGFGSHRPINKRKICLRPPAHLPLSLTG